MNRALVHSSLVTALAGVACTVGEETVESTEPYALVIEHSDDVGASGFVIVEGERIDVSVENEGLAWVTTAVGEDGRVYARDAVTLEDGTTSGHFDGHHYDEAGEVTVEVWRSLVEGEVGEVVFAVSEAGAAALDAATSATETELAASLAILGNFLEGLAELEPAPVGALRSTATWVLKEQNGYKLCWPATEVVLRTRSTHGARVTWDHSFCRWAHRKQRLWGTPVWKTKNFSTSDEGRINDGVAGSRMYGRSNGKWSYKASIRYCR